MHAQKISTTARANEATPIGAKKAKRAALTVVLPGETPVQAAIRAVEVHRRDVMEPASKAHTAAEVATWAAKEALKAAAFPTELVVPHRPKLTDDPLTWVTSLVFRHPDGREEVRHVGEDRTERLTSRQSVINYFGAESPELEARLASFDRWEAEIAPLKAAVDKAQAAEEKADRAWRRSYAKNDALCRAILSAPAQPYEAAAQVEAYARLLSAACRHKFKPIHVSEDDLNPMIEFMLRALKRIPAPTPEGPAGSFSVATLYPQWEAAKGASGDERPGHMPATYRFAELETQIETTPCRTVADSTAKLKVLLDVYEDGGIVLDHGHLIGQLKDAISGLDEDARRREWIADGSDAELIATAAEYISTRAERDIVAAAYYASPEGKAATADVFEHAPFVLIYERESALEARLADMRARTPAGLKALATAAKTSVFEPEEAEPYSSLLLALFDSCIQVASPAPDSQANLVGVVDVASPMLDALAERNRIVDHLNGGSDLPDEEFDRQHDLGWDLNNLILDDDSRTPDSALAKLRLILRADVVEGLHFNEGSVLSTFRSAIAAMEAAYPMLSREDAGLDEADRAGVWIDNFLAAGGSIIREFGADGPDRIDYQAAQSGTALLRELEAASATFAKEVRRIALDRMTHLDVDLLSSAPPMDPLALAAE